MRALPFAFAAWGFVLLGPASAQELAPVSVSEDVVVVGQRTEEAVRSFVEALTAAPRNVDQLARWDRRICPGVAGLRARYAQFVIDRLAQRAFEVDLSVGEPGCRPNILIVVTPDPDAVARQLYDEHRRALGYFSERGSATRGRTALRETFLNSDAPVRWWHVSNTASSSGEDIQEPAPNGAVISRGGDIFDIMNVYPVNMVSGGSSRLRANTRQDLGSAFVIVDANRLAEIEHDFNALADYLAMVSLAQLDPEADTSAFPSVLNLWDAAAEAPSMMTDWDLAYLRGLYASRRDTVSIGRQEGDIARDMLRDGVD